MTTVYVIEKCVYGNDMLYPDCEASKALCEALGVKTLNGTAWRVAKALHMTIKVRGTEKTLLGGGQ